MELVLCDVDCLVEKHGATSHIKPIRMLHLDVHSVQVLVPRERWRHLDGYILVLLNAVNHELVLRLDLACGFYSRLDGFIKCLAIKRVNH